MPHDHSHGPEHGHEQGQGHGHNHGPTGEHLHSYMQGPEPEEALKVLGAQFVEGFLAASDKIAFLRLSGVPFERVDDAGGPALKLVDVALRTDWQVGTASPGFGTEELSYLPFAGAMVAERTRMAFVYVSLRRRVEVDLLTFLSHHAAVQDTAP